MSARRSMRHLWWALRLLPTAAIELVAAALLVLSVCVFHGAGLDAATVAAAVVVAATVLLRLTDSGPPRR